MKVIGVKALKARLSEYLRAVRRGETILVTDRDEVIAELRPASRAGAPQGDLEDRLDRLAESGELTRAVQAKAGWSWRVTGLGLPEGAALAVIDDLRAER
jgi:prevent-host-death family protein